MSVEINCDMGESFGLYKMGDDEGVMPFISQANVACGFHGSDPNHMRHTVELAQKHGRGACLFTRFGGVWAARDED